MNDQLFLVVSYDTSSLIVSSDPSANEFYNFNIEPIVVVPDSNGYSTIGASERELAKHVYPKPHRSSVSPVGEDLGLL